MKILNRMKLKNKRRKISCYVLKRKKCVTNETYKKKKLQLIILTARLYSRNPVAGSMQARVKTLTISHGDRRDGIAGDSGCTWHPS